MKWKRSNDALKAKKKKLREASAPTSSKRTPNVESRRSSKQVEAPTHAPAPLMSMPSKSSQIVQPTSPTSLVILKIARSPRWPTEANTSSSAREELVILHKELKVVEYARDDSKLAKELLDMILLPTKWKEHGTHQIEHGTHQIFQVFGDSYLGIY